MGAPAHRTVAQSVGDAVRSVNRKTRKARKMFLRKYQRATCRWWRQVRLVAYDELAEMTPDMWKKLYDACCKLPKAS